MRDAIARTGRHALERSYGETLGRGDRSGQRRVQLNDSVLVYASIAQGFKGGGWDFIPPTPEAAQISFDPEKVTNYELGLKSDSSISACA